MLAFVTGAAGFLGSHLADRLPRDGWDVDGIDNFATGDERNLSDARASERFHFVHADVSEPWTDWLAAFSPTLRRPAVVFHLASPASPVHYERLALETLTVNGIGTMHAYRGNVNSVGIRSCYDESKRFGEAYVSTAVRKLAVDARIVRIFNAYGPRMQAGDGRVIPNFCTSALRGEPLTVYGSGSQTRSFCYVDDLIEGLIRLATRPSLTGRVV